MTAILHFMAVLGCIMVALMVWGLYVLMKIMNDLFALRLHFEFSPNTNRKTKD